MCGCIRGSGSQNASPGQCSCSCMDLGIAAFFSFMQQAIVLLTSLLLSATQWRRVLIKRLSYSDYLYGTDEESPLPAFHSRAKKFTEWGAICTGIEYEGHGRHAKDSICVLENFFLPK